MIDYPILILHGWNLTSATYQPLIAKLQKKGYTVVAPDLPGFGRRAILSGPLKLEDYSLFVEKYLRTKHIKEVIIVGHSFGGRIGLRFAASNPKWVKALVLTGVPGFPPISALKVKTFFILSKIGTLIFKIPPFCFFERGVRKLFHKIAGARDYAKTGGYLKKTFQSIISYDLIEIMKSIKTPILLIWGENDGIVPRGIAQKMNLMLKNNMLKIISDANHKVPYSHPKEFIDLMEEFFSKKSYV